MVKKKAEMSILGALIAFALIILMCPVFEFYNISRKAEIAENNIKATLKDVCVSDAIVRYNDVKYVTDNDITIDTDKYEEAIFDSLGYTNKNIHEWSKNETEISNFSLRYNSKSRSFIVKYDISMPFKILNKTVKTSTVSKKDVVAFEYVKVDSDIKGSSVTIKNIIPDGGVYTIASTGETRIGNGVNTFPETTNDGDIYTYGDYEYRYNYIYYFEDYDGESSWIPVSSKFAPGWGVAVRDNTKTYYGEIPSYINYQPVTSLSFTFYKCANMASAPNIPDTVTSLYHAFDSSGIKSSPVIPNSVQYMWCAFRKCKSLTTASAIPEFVKEMGYCFFDCPLLTGTIEINTNSIVPAENGLAFCFNNTRSPIRLIGKSSRLNDFAATANYNNITVG